MYAIITHRINKFQRIIPHFLYIKAHICNNHSHDYLSKARLCIIYTPRYIYVIDTHTRINYIQFQYIMTSLSLSIYSTMTEFTIESRYLDNSYQHHFSSQYHSFKKGIFGRKKILKNHAYLHKLRTPKYIRFNSIFYKKSSYSRKISKY